MEDQYRFYFGSSEEGVTQTPQDPRHRGRGIRLRTLLICLCVAVVLTSVVASVFAVTVTTRYYEQQLLSQQEMIARLQSQGRVCDLETEQLEVLAALFEKYSYYHGKIDQEELLQALLHAYAEATGDKYAAYYTVEEYAALQADNAGNHVGIGIVIVEETLTVADVEQKIFLVTEVYEGSPAAAAGMRPGDAIYAYTENGVLYTLEQVGYDTAKRALRGEVGSRASVTVYRKAGTAYESHSFTMLRSSFTAPSVTSYRSVKEPSVAVIRISQFDLQTPLGLKTEIRRQLAEGAEYFVLDVRNNPGGDLQSVKSSLSYFLQKGDLILRTIDREGNVKASYVAEAVTHTGDYAPCTVEPSEVGMFANLKTVVLCNGSSASAAEVFTATLRDHGLSTVVGEQSFGKGIMQTFFDLSVFPNCEGFAKMTSYAYVTACGVSYHDVGIVPDVAVSLSEEAKGYYSSLLPQELDNQLDAAVAYLRAGRE